MWHIAASTRHVRDLPISSEAEKRKKNDLRLWINYVISNGYKNVKMVIKERGWLSSTNKIKKS